MARTIRTERRGQGGALQLCLEHGWIHDHDRESGCSEGNLYPHMLVECWCIRCELCYCHKEDTPRRGRLELEQIEENS